tara:strand:- start:426 stop:1562 length:1137 start_codon:yes stop_codon:yes gene_type:complete
MSQVAVRVKDIILNIEHPQAINFGGYDAIGTIFFTKLDDNTPLEQTWTSINNTARPIFSFLKNYPLKNEIVLIMSSYDKNIYNTGGFTNYYFPNLNIWNHPHHNALPTTKGISDDASKRDYKQTENGLAVRQIEDEGTNIDLGDYFKEQTKIKPLLPYEGDTIIEGRFGNSIRFGSTNIGESILEENKNRWSNNSTVGDPILIIRNGQLEETDGKGWVHSIEDIDDDASSIYLTSNQKLDKFIPASIYQKSFGANLKQSENINTLLTDPPLNIISEPEIEEQEISDEEEPILNSPPPVIKEKILEEEIVPERVVYYDVAPSDNNVIDQNTEVQLDEKSIKSLTDYNITSEELDKPLGSFFIEPIPAISDQTDLEQYTP